MAQNFRGIFAIIQTPFDEKGTLVWEDFERECDWLARSGAHGLVWPVMASEYPLISYPERVQGMRLAVQVVNKRIPVVIGVADTSKAGAVALAEEAGRAGADAIIAMPPWHIKLATRELVEDYYYALAQAAGLPVIVQNCDPPLGSGLPAEFVVELCEKIPLVQYLKEEKSPQGHAISQVLSLASPAVKGVFSGASADWLISEYERGVCGNMPACVTPDIDAQIWNLLEEGKKEEARRLHNLKVVLDNALRCMPSRRARKEVLVRRGVISSPYGRNLGAAKLDEVDLAELDYALSLLEPYFTV
ncbi:MAG: dihydrodipicolinate synthase family protein [Anaerolineae bacterium]|nr:dihydrodipicolinate synthase family protein [Anaerolineae bacterium]